MRWIRYTAGDATSYGILDGDTITAVTGNPFDGYEKTTTTHALASVKIALPLEPKTFYAVGFIIPSTSARSQPSRASSRTCRRSRMSVCALQLADRPR